MISRFLKMNQQNMSSTPTLPMKRKRGRPRKDETIARTEIRPAIPATPSPAPPPPTIPPPPPPTIAPTNNTNKLDHSMVGQAVTCVIDGIFDNGYLLSARIGPNNSILRGIVFQQGHVSPITPANDVAPHVDMCTRAEVPVPPSNPRNHTQFCTPHSPHSVCAKQPVPMQNYQNTPPMVAGGSSASGPHENLMVEQDDVMQVFEVSKTVEQDTNDPMAENLRESDLNSENVKDKNDDHEPVVNDLSPNELSVKEPSGGNPELITTVETVVENQPLMRNDLLQQESKEQEGESSKVDANQDPNREIAVDLSLSNFPEI